MKAEEKNNRAKFYVLSYENKYKVWDPDSSSANIFYVNDLTENEAKELLVQEVAILILFKGTKEQNPAWLYDDKISLEGLKAKRVNNVQAAIITLTDAERNVLDEFIQKEFPVKRFGSRTELSEWKQNSGEGRLFDQVGSIYLSKYNGPDCIKINH